MTELSADEVRRFGIAPRVALLSHSNFGSSNAQSAQKMRTARHLIVEQAPDLEVEGEMQADLAVRPEIRQRIFPNSVLLEQANLLVMPDLDAANIAFNLMKQLADGLPDSVYVLFENSGHFAPLEEPKRVESMVFDFVGVE